MQELITAISSQQLFDELFIDKHAKLSAPPKAAAGDEYRAEEVAGIFGGLPAEPKSGEDKSAKPAQRADRAVAANLRSDLFTLGAENNSRANAHTLVRSASATVSQLHVFRRRLRRSKQCCAACTARFSAKWRA